VFDKGRMPEELTEAYAETIRSCQALVDLLLRDFSLGPKRVEVRFVEDWSLNAFAGKDVGDYVIGIQAGIIPKLLGPITAALSMGCLASVKDRDRLALWILNAAVEFLVFHELGHISLGHVTYHEAARKRGPGAANPMKLSAPDEQALELMADEFAITATAATRFDPQYVDETALPEFSDVTIKYHAYLFAIGLIFLIVTPREAFPSFSATRHPHPEFRTIVAWARLFTKVPPPPQGLDEQVRADLARMPKILGIPDDAFVGLCWSDDPGRQVSNGAYRKLVEMFEQHGRAVQRMRPIMDRYREDLTGEGG
jgi:hypothetical protein